MKYERSKASSECILTYSLCRDAAPWRGLEHMYTAVAAHDNRCRLQPGATVTFRVVCSIFIEDRTAAADTDMTDFCKSLRAIFQQQIEMNSAKKPTS